jgi:hypothetical protein
MDLQLILRVLWRFKLIVAFGLIVAIALSVVSYAEVSFEGGKPAFTPRSNEQWESLSTLFVTSRGFPWGAAVRPREDPTRPGVILDQGKNPGGLDPVHLTALAELYVRLATSDAVMQEVFPDGKPTGTLQAFPVNSDDAGDGAVLPMVTLSAITTTAQGARQLAQRHADAFVEYIEREQQRANIPPEERVVIEIARRPQGASLLQARKKTRPMVVFVAVMLAVVGLAFTLENLRPRVRVLPAESSRPFDAEAGDQPQSTRATPAAAARHRSRNTA